MKRNWLSVMVLIAVTLSVWGGLPSQKVKAADSDIVISEVMYNPRCTSASVDTCTGGTGATEDRFEWIEIYNRGTDPVTLSNWHICDFRTTVVCRTIPLTTIGSHETWVIGYNGTAFQSELVATGHSGAWDAARFIALNATIGNGLTNNITSGAAEGVRLLNGSGAAIDCVTWASTAGTGCGAEGQNTTVNNAGQAVSITNIQGTWYFHGPGSSASTDQSSPFDANNVGQGGSPNAVTLSDLSANNTASPAPVVFGTLGLIAAAMLLRRKAAHTTSN